jgi:hypothetical protein
MTTPNVLARHRAFCRLFPEFPSWAIAPFTGAPQEPFRVPEAFAAKTKKLIGPRGKSRREERIQFRVAPDTGAPWDASRATVHLSREEMVPTPWHLESGQWHMMIQRETGAELVAFWRYWAWATVVPFGTRMAFGTRDVRQPPAPWTPRRHAADAPLPDHATPQIHADILTRWETLDPTSQDVLTRFWLGHELPELAALGMATLQHTQHQHTQHQHTQRPARRAPR